MGKLTQAQIQSIDTPGRYGDGAALWLVVTKRGTKAWVLRTVVDGVRRDIGLGGWPRVSVRDARLKAAETRDQIKKGIHRTNRIQPAALGPAAPTFSKEFYSYYHRNCSVWKNPRSGQNFLSVGRRYLLPYLGDIPVSDIRKMDVVQCLEKIAGKIPTRRLARTIAKQTFERSVTLEIIPSNPALDLEGALPQQTYRSKSQPSISYREMPAAYQLIGKLPQREGRGFPTSPSMAAMLQFLILTAARSIEAREARWDEIDLNHMVWVIQPERMKTGILHRVPLSSPAWRILQRAMNWQGSSEYIFPNPKTGKVFGTSGPKYHIQKLAEHGLHGTQHGFRAAFRTWASETRKYEYDEMEYALSHVVGDSGSRPYIRTDLLERRREMMDDWASYLIPDSQLALAI